jgi:hypothetical protein
MHINTLSVSILNLNRKTIAMSHIHTQGKSRYYVKHRINQCGLFFSPTICIEGMGFVDPTLLNISKRALPYISINSYPPPLLHLFNCLIFLLNLSLQDKTHSAQYWNPSMVSMSSSRSLALSLWVSNYQTAAWHKVLTDNYRLSWKRMRHWLGNYTRRSPSYLGRKPKPQPLVSMTSYARSLN